MLRIALIPGDGVGVEVVPEAQATIEACGVEVEWTEFPWGSAYWHETGAMMPPDALEIVRQHDAVLLGAVGDPTVPDHISLWGLLLELRQRLDLWANERPVRLLPGIPGPLAGAGPEDIDMLFIRENTEGEYSGAGGRVHRGLPHEAAVETGVFSRHAIERIVRHAFKRATERRGFLVSATKSNAGRHGYVLWDEVVEEVASDFPSVRWERVLVDALAARMVTDPASLDVVVASNLFADILTDIGAALQGSMGMAASANLAPGDSVPGVFEPVHGSAPDIAGQGVANPLACIWSAALLLDAVGERAASTRVMAAIEHVVEHGPRTRDVGGDAGTKEVGEAARAALGA